MPCPHGLSDTAPNSLGRLGPGFLSLVTTEPHYFGLVLRDIQVQSPGSLAVGILVLLIFLTLVLLLPGPGISAPHDTLGPVPLVMFPLVLLGLFQILS